MSLARAWRRQLLGASGIAVLVPASAIVAIALLALAGGFAHLGGLGQAFSGPTLPTSTSRASGGLAGGVAHHAGPGSPTVGLGAALLLASTTDAGGPGGTAGALAPNGSNGAGSPGRGSGHFTGGPQPVPGGTGGNPSPPTPNPPQPPPHQTLVDGVVKIGTSVTSKLPGPVGQAATQALQSVGRTVDKILPAPPNVVPPVVSGKLPGSVHIP